MALFEDFLTVENGTLKTTVTEIPWEEPHESFPRQTYVSALNNAIVSYHKVVSDRFFFQANAYQLYELYHGYKQSPMYPSVFGPEFAVIYRDPHVPLRIEIRCADGGPASAEIAELMGVVLYRKASHPEQHGAISCFYRTVEFTTPQGQTEREHVFLIVMGSAQPEKSDFPFVAFNHDESDLYKMIAVHLVPHPELTENGEIPIYINILRSDLDWSRFKPDQPTILHQHVGHDGKPGTGLMVPNTIFTIVTSPPSWVITRDGRTVGLPTTLWKIFRAVDYQTTIERLTRVER